MDKLVQEVHRVLDWYSSIDSSFNDIDMLIKAKRKVIGLSFRFSAVVGECLEEYNNSYAFRKRHIADKKLEYIKEGDTIGKAELRAELLNYKFRVDEGSNEAIYRKVKGYFDTMRDAVSSLTQDISILRKEYEETKNHDNG